MTETPKSGSSRRWFLTAAGLTLTGVLGTRRVLSAVWAGARPAKSVGQKATGGHSDSHTPDAEAVDWPAGLRMTMITRRVIVLSQEAAWALGDHRLAPEHLLLGIVNHSRLSVASSILERLGLSTEGIRHELLQQLPHGPGTGTQMIMTSRCRQVLVYAVEEAGSLGNTYTGTEHLLLGLLRERNRLAARVLRKHGVTAERVKEQIAAILQGAVRPGN